MPRKSTNLQFHLAHRITFYETQRSDAMRNSSTSPFCDFVPPFWERENVTRNQRLDLCDLQRTFGSKGEYFFVHRWRFQTWFGIFTPNLGEMIQVHQHIFQLGWFNHQLGNDPPPSSVAFLDVVESENCSSRFENTKNWFLNRSPRIQICPKKGINPTILLWGWDWDHQTYSRERYGSLGLNKFS